MDGGAGEFFLGLACFDAFFRLQAGNFFGVL
jgi:hypothetical protein